MSMRKSRRSSTSNGERRSISTAMEMKKEVSCPMQIRTSVSNDIPRILGLWKEFMDFHKERDPAFTRSVTGHEGFRSFVEENMKSETAQVLVADAGNSLVGYCLARITERPPVFEDRRYGQILDLAVAAPRRRGGVGEALLGEALKWFQKQRISRVDVAVSTANEVASAFWEKHGFKTYMQVRRRDI
jgi:ribosomal protein S18 acetylase RimI-like enzyme